MAVAEETLRHGNCVFVVSPVAGYTPDVLLERYDFEREGVLWRVKERKLGDGAITIH
jgi:hypothetical protein